MEDFEVLTEAELGARKNPRSSALDESDLAGIDAEVAARKQALDMSLRQSVPVEPDTAAKEKNIALQTGVPMDVVGRNAEQMKTQARVQELSGILAASPILARQMADPQFAKLAHDDAENLSLFERTLAMPRAAVAGLLADTPAAIYGWGEALAKLLAPALDPLAGRILPENPLRRVAAGLENFRKQSEAAGKAVAGPQSKDVIEGGISSGFRSVGNMAPGILMSVITGNPQFALGTGAVTQGGQSVAKGIDAGLPPVQAITYGLEDAAAEYATELIPMTKLLKDIKASAPFWKILGNQIVREVPTELAATAWQNFNEWSNLHSDQPFQSYLEKLPEDEAQTLVATITATVLTAGFGRAVSRYQQKNTQQADAVANDGVMRKLFEIAADDELRRRSPLDFGQFVQQAAEEHGSSTIYIDAATFAQEAQAKGLDVAATMPVTAAQIEEAIALKGDLRIPLGEATAVLPGTGLENTLLEHMRMSPDAPSLKETQDKAFEEETQKAVEQVMTQQSFDEAINTSRMAVENEMLAQHTATNRFTADVNRVYAKMDAAFYTVMGQRIGLTPEQMYVKYPKLIQAAPVGGENVMKQFSPSFANWFEKSYVTATGQPGALPLVVFRGEHGETDEQVHTRLPSITFTATPESASTYATYPNRSGETAVAPRVVPAYLSIKKPVIVNLDDPFIDMQQIADAIGKEKALELADELDDGLRATGRWMEDVEPEGYESPLAYLTKNPDKWAELYLDAFRVFDNAKAVAAFKAKGFDGAIHLGNGETATEPEYRVFSKSQIKSAIGNRGTFKAADENILNQETIDNDTGALDEQPPFYSALSMQVAAAKMNNAPAAQWKSFINSLSQKGVKKDEIAMSGVLDWLDTIGQPPKPKEVVEISERLKAVNSDGVEPKLLVQGKSLFEWLTDEGALLSAPAITVANAILDARESSRPTQAVNWRDAKLYVLSALGINEDERVIDMDTGNALALRAITTLKELDEAGEVRFEDLKSTAVVPVAEPAAQVKPADTRVSKQQVVDYLAQNGVRVETKILGAPESEQENAKPGTAVATLPEGYRVKPGAEEGRYTVVDISGDAITGWHNTPALATAEALREINADKPDVTLPPGYEVRYQSGAYVVVLPNRTTLLKGEGNMAVTADTEYAAAAEGLRVLQTQGEQIVQEAERPLPDDYDIEEEIYNEGEDDQYSEYLVRDPDGERVGDLHDTREEAIDEAWSDAESRAINDDTIEEKARELWNDSYDSRAEGYYQQARESDYVGYEIELKLPGYEIVEHPVDLLNAEEHYTINKIEYRFDQDPDDASDLKPHRSAWPEKFKTHREATKWAKGMLGSDAFEFVEGEEEEMPHYVAVFSEADHSTEISPNRDDVESEADKYQEQLIEQEAQFYAENDNFEDDKDHYMELAERELREEFERDQGQTANTRQHTYRAPQIKKPKDKLALQHKGSYQSDGGRDYRELVVGVPNIDEYNARDSTHFGHVFEGRTVAWARVKVHDDARKTPVFFIEEIQSQRAQAGREQGFINEEGRQAREAHRIAFDKATDAIQNLNFRSIAQWDDAMQYVTGDLADLANVANVDLKGRIETARQHQNEIMPLILAESAAKQEMEAKPEGTVPTAPFMQNTQAWTALTFKRLLRYAVDQGYKRVAWTPGLEQVERYEGALRNSVRSIDWKKTEKGIEIMANGQRLNRQGDTELKFSDKELRHAIGPSMAQRIINDPGQEGSIEGEDIKIDDLWPQGYYGDEHGLNAKGEPAVLTIVANKILKGLGGQAVKSIGMDLKEGSKEYDAAPGFEITDAMAEKIKAGQALFQQNRGQITFGSDIKGQPSVVTLLEHADLSTYVHESGHYYLEVLADMAAQPDAPLDVQADMQRILDWFGIPTLANWNDMKLEDKRPYHERFARGFERYMFEGKSPNLELSGMFSRFRAWMLNVYRELVALKVDLTPEVRGVFDRMLASNDEIVAAEAARAYAPLFKTAEEMGATPEEWKAYQEQGLEATQDAIAMLESRSLRDMKWLSNAKSRVLKALQKQADAKRSLVTKEVTTEVRSTPTYAALRFLTHGELPEGNYSNAQRKVLDDFAGKRSQLSIAALKALYGDGPAAPWRYLNTGKFGHLAAEDGLDPGMVAELFGFTSADHLVKEILAADPEADVIDAMTDRRMLERYGDLSSPQAIEDAANEAIHNEARAKFLATELRSLAKATGQKNILAKAAKEFAATLIARKKLTDIRPVQYTTAEARAGRNAERAKSLVEKATEKRNQIVNHYAAKAAYDALGEVDKGVTYLRRVGDSKTIDADYREQIVALLDRFDLRPITNKDAQRRESLAQWIEEQAAQGFEPVIDPELLDETKRVPYKNMTLEEFRGLVDAVKNIEHLGRLKHRLLLAKDAREFQAIVTEAAESIMANAKRSIKPPIEQTRWIKTKGSVAHFFAWHRKFSSMIREMDGYNDDGILTRLFLRDMNKAGDTEAVRREQATMRLQALLKPVLKEGKMSAKTYIPAINASLSREGRIMVALNMGTEGNLQRLLDGDSWNINQAKAVLDTLTKTEMDFVQGIWNFVGEFKNEIGAQQKRITGVAPEWVEPRVIQTKHGDYAGGYIPAKYDTTRSTRSLSDEAAAGIMDQWRAKRGAAKTRDSFTKARAKKVVDRPLRKDFGVITQHVTEVTHRLAWQEYLIDAQRLLRAGKIDHAIREHYGPEILEALRNTIQDIAAGEVGAQNAFEQGLNYVRTGATIAGLGWRLTTSMLQPIGLTQSWVRIGAKHVAAGMVEWLGDAAKFENTAAKISEKSDFMRLRAKTMQREISEIRNVVAGKNSAIEASYFYLIQKMQLVADIPTWLGQYHKAVDAGADEKSAVAQADQAVIDAQGSGMIKDLSAAQRGGPLQKLFTNFYSFFNTTYNMTSEAVGRTSFKNPLSVGRLAVDLLMLYSVPAALGTLLKAALHGGDDDQDEKKLIRQLIADQLTYLFGTMVGLRELAGGLQTAAGLPGDYQGPASVRLFAELAKFGKQAGQGELDEAFWKALNNSMGILLHYPSGQIGATVDGIVTMSEGRTDHPGALIVGSNKK